jgi:branched-chain amino acid transport system ATP-binding protein
VTETVAERAPTGSADRNKILELEDVHTYYGSIHAIKGVSLDVYDGEVVTLIGANGAGKSTTLRSINGLNHPREGRIRFQGRDITQESPHNVVKMGISQSPEGRRLFPRMSVMENLEMGAFQRDDKSGIKASLDRVFELFPRLQERKSQRAGTMSGGEQQMCAIGRALMARPKLLMLDEPSLGLAPRLVAEIFEIIKRLNAELGATVIVVEQNARSALEIASYGFVMENGRIVLDGPAAELAENPDVMEFYLGLTEAGERRSYRAVKHYKRRKRWL